MKSRHLTLTRTGRCMIARFLCPISSGGLTLDVLGEVEELCAEIDGDEEIRVVVLVFQGARQASETRDCAGEGRAAARIVDLVARLAQPVIAALEGDAVGLALELALACDIRIGLEGGRFGLSQIGEGSIPCAGGTQRLPRLVGPGKALEMVLTGESIDAGEAHRIGLVQRVVPAGELMERATALATEMASASPLSMRYVKEALYSGQDLTLEQGMRMELDLYLLLFSTGDRVEGISAFKEKRKPEFRGA